MAVHNAFMASAVRDEIPGAEVVRVSMPMTPVDVPPSACALCASVWESRRTSAWSARSGC